MTNANDQGGRLAFSITAELAEEMLSAIENIRGDASDKDHVTALIDVVLKLTDAGLGEYYLRPLEQADAGLIALGSAKLGVSTARRGISALVNKVLRGMSEDQLRSIADSMERMLIR